MNETSRPPRVFVSYARESDAHMEWVRQLCERLRGDHIDVIFDQWHLTLGDDLARFIEESTANSDYVLLICTETYVERADERFATVGIEVSGFAGLLLNAAQVRQKTESRLVPLVRQHVNPRRLPRFLSSRIYVDLSDDVIRPEESYDQLRRKFHKVPKHSPPPLGPNPFTQVVHNAEREDLERAARKRPSPYIAGAVELPVKGLTVKVLHDQTTAITGAVDGQIAAIDLRDGKLLAAAVDEEIRKQARPGGGENHYIAGKYFFLERSPIEQRFFTMSHSAVLNVWSFDGRLRQEDSIPLLTPHFGALRSAILKRIAKGPWSNWTCYSQTPPEVVPSGIVDAKLSPDGSSILCLTDWFAIFRCDLAGRLRDEPMVVADAFSIEPANPDGSEVWVGRGSRENVLLRLGFRKDFDAARCATVRGSFGSYGIHTLSEQALYAGGPVLETSGLKEISGSQLSIYMGARPLVVPEAGCVLSISDTLIRCFNLKTLRDDGKPLVGGHEGEIRGLDATRDGSHLVSVSERTLRVWDLKDRVPVGGGPPAAEVLSHGMQSYRTGFQTASGKVVCSTSGRLAVIDMVSSTVTSMDADLALIGAASGKQASEIHLLSLDSREGPPLPGVKGIISRMVKMPPPVQHWVRQQTLNGNRFSGSSSCLLADNSVPRSVWEPSASRSQAIDIGNGRVALLLGGHLAVFDVNTRAVVCGPIDISTPSSGPSAHGWYLYSQLAASADGERLFVRGNFRNVKVFNAFNLRELGEIPGTAGHCGLLVPWSDPRYVMFAIRVTPGHDRHGYKEILVLADAEAGVLAGKICDLRSAGREDPHQAIVLGEGTGLAFLDYGSDAMLLDLTTGQIQEQPLIRHSASINSIHEHDEPGRLMTVSIDGTARWSDVRGRLPAKRAGFSRPHLESLADVTFVTH